MKKNILLTFTFISFIIWGTNAQTCLPNGITLNTQAQVNSFAINFPDCTEILGDVKIQGVGLGTITNLSGLSQLNSIRGSLNICGSAALTSLTGLENLSSIGGNFAIEVNSALN